MVSLSLPGRSSTTTKTTTTTDWRPWPLRLTFLLPFTTLCLLIIVGLEFIYRACSPNGCPVFGSPPSDDFQASAAQAYSLTTNFVYNYLPTICTVTFGLVCALIHHDVLRMEPWFQLSSDGGATAEDSLLVEYSYMFPAYVPIEAAKKRHWSVVVSSILILFSTAVLTPMVAGLFDDAILTDVTTLNTTYPGLRWAFHPSEMSIDVQGGYSPRHSYLAYTHAWQNGSLPPFSTAEYALSPWALAAPEIAANAAFSVIATTNTTNASSSSSEQQQQDETWTGPTMLYEADLECEEAIRTPYMIPGIGLMGYNLTYPSYPHISWSLLDVGMVNATDYDLIATFANMIPNWDTWSYYKERPRFQTGADYYVSGDIPQLNDYVVNDTALDEIRMHTIMYLWAAAPPPMPPAENMTFGHSLLPPRWAAVFCQPRYYEVPVTATIAMPSGAVRNVTRGPAEERRVIASNNNTSFVGNFLRDMNEGLIRTVLTDPAIINGQGDIVGLGTIPQTPADSNPHLAERFGGTEARLRVQAKQDNEAEDGFLAYALYGQSNSTLESLFEWENLAEMYRGALKLTFAMLCTDEWLLAQSEANSTVAVVQTRKARGFRVSAGWCRAAQAGFAVVAVVAGGGLMALLGGRRSYLDGEPNSITSTLALLHRSPEVAGQMESAEFHEMKTVRRMLRTSGTRYRLRLDLGVGPRLEIVEGTVGAVGLEGPASEKEEEHREKEEWPMSTASAVFFAFFFVAMLALAVTLYVFVGLDKGVPSPARRNSFGYKILFTYLPTLFGLLIEPLLVSLGAHYCMLGPYKSLRRGFAPSKRSLSLDFDKSPPHFQLLRSLRAGDIILAALTLCILLSNVLAVSLSALFSPSNRAFPASATVQVPAAPSFTKDFANSSLMDAHYTLYSSLSGEIAKPSWTTNEYYILPFSIPALSGLATATAPTIGLGASVSCALVPADKISASCTKSGSGLNTTNCPTSTVSDVMYGFLTVDDPCWPEFNKQNYTYGRTYMSWTLPAGDYLAHVPEKCPATFFAAWAELPAAGSSNSSRAYLPQIDSTVLKCTVAELAVGLSATVDAAGNVLAVADVVPLSDADAGAMKNKGGVQLAASFVNSTWASSNFIKVPLGMGWFNSHMVKLYPDVVRAGRNISHLPDTAVVAGALEDVVTRLYATGLRMYAEELMDDGGEAGVRAAVMTAVEMVEVSMAMLGVGMGILLLMAAVVAALYVCAGRGTSEVAHAPKSLAAMWALLYGSDAKEVCGGVMGGSASARVRGVDALGKRFGYGRFVGTDGRSHVGVYVQDEKEQEDDDIAGVTRTATLKWWGKK